MTIKAVFWDFGGVITTSPFDSFNKFELENKLPTGFIRSINATTPKNNAWAKLEKSEISLEEFNKLFFKESSDQGYGIHGTDVINLLKGEIRPEMVIALKNIKGKLIQACLTNNIKALNEEKIKNNKSIAGSITDEIFQLFDFVIESSKINVRKPEPNFYLLACKKANVVPDEAIFLDDLGINLKPARELGMNTIKVIKSMDALKELQTFLSFPVL